jgi:hypothetical protein
MIFIWVQGFRSPLAFAINREDNISMLKDHCPFSFGKKQLPIFIDKGILQILQTNIEVVRSYLSKVDIREKIEFLDLQSNESIHFSGGGIILYYKQRPLHDLLNALDILYFLADRLPRVKSEKVDLSKLPVEFHSLVPLIEKFSISDDDLRNDKLKKTPAEEKKKLHQIVKPVLPRINVYLDSFGNNPLSEEAALLMHLAEAVAELEMTNNKDN